MFEVHQANVILQHGGTGEVGTITVPGLVAPSDSLGGAITIVGVKYYSRSAIAAASAPQYECVTLSSADAVSGTVHAALASAAWTAGTARTGTVSDGFVDANERVAFVCAQTAANAATIYTRAIISYVMGY